MPSGQTVINGALTTLGINEQGGTPSASDSTDALTELNRMWNAWGIDDGLIYNIRSAQYTLSAAVASYTIGAGATFNATRPSRIYQAVAVATVGAGAVRRPLEIVDSGRYHAHGDLAAAATMPDELYPDFNVDASGYARLYLWPVPSVLTATALELETAVPFTDWTLSAVTLLPDGYADAINDALAFRLIPRFGMIVPAEVLQIVTAAGQKAEARIRVMNERNRRLEPGAGMIPATPPAKAA